ncbi:protein disulfide-isomerase a6-like protein [Lasius niger]|uniref:Protein disulfide-isomerase a6-like protein n=1 Tax=Lasius niger TaxID=67767 RepID=A0A0J7KA95_LASNI|nr:protein disulfide-isomerase a6-like protein [Lasius niger]
MIICDGTYYRHQKSSNNNYQRKAYSVQKGVPLCKPFTICTTNGFIIDVAGPFYANQNDATILKIVMSQEDGLSSLMKEGDIFVLDRGFRDIKNELENRRYRVLIPAFKGKRKQLTTKESNDSRFVTKVRWPVEAVHGVLGKKYRLLHNQLDNKLLPKTMLLCKVACFLNNTFGKRFNSDHTMVQEVVDQMNDRNDIENTLAEEVENNNWSRKTVPFQKITSEDLIDFPEMSERELKIFFTGTYQLSQAISYLAEMLDDNNNIRLSFLKENTNIVKLEVPSRHKKKQIYKCYIQYNPNTIGKSGILRYACDCANGRRTIGCCSHLAAIIYYLSHARYLSRIVKPVEKLQHIFDSEDIVPTINDDSDED